MKISGLISRLFEKRGIKDASELQGSERVDFDRWQAIISSEDVTIDKVREFCENQCKLIEAEWKNLDNSERRNERLIAYHVVYKTLVSIVGGDMGRPEREALEKYLTDLIAKA